MKMIIKSANNKNLELKKVNIICNLGHENASESAKEVLNFLSCKNINAQKEDIYPACHQESREFSTDATFVIVIGGDGTLISAARFYAKYGVPVFGINSGRLGFLAQLRAGNIKKGLEKVFNGEFNIEDRMMLKASDTNDGISFDALNDIVVKGGTLSRTARLYLYINGKQVCDYVADGVIISTPTGSTAYTLSAGGPVVVPGMEAMIIVPICAHSLTTRSLVVPSDEKIEIKTCSECELIYLTADGQENHQLDVEDRIFIQRNEKCAKLVLLDSEESGFYSILREKLHWGVSPRG